MAIAVTMSTVQDIAGRSQHGASLRIRNKSSDCPSQRYSRSSGELLTWLENQQGKRMDKSIAQKVDLDCLEAP